MATLQKILDSVRSGRSDRNLRFADLRRLALRLGFSGRQSGTSHHIFHRDGVEEILNFQPLKGGGAKPYQVKQFRAVVIRYGLQLPERDA